MGDFLLVMTLPGVLTFFIATDTGLMADMLRVDGFLTGNDGLATLGSSLSVPADTVRDHDHRRSSDHVLPHWENENLRSSPGYCADPEHRTFLDLDGSFSCNQ